MFNNCNECPNHNSSSCPFANRSEGHKRRVCQLLRLGFKSIDPLIDLNSNPNDIWRDKLRSILFPPMDYNRNDTGDIAHRFDPNLN